MKQQTLGMKRETGKTLRLFAAAALLCASVQAQQIDLGVKKPVGRDHVELLSDAVDVTAGKTQDVELRFRVDPGFHINSHTPTDEFLIPTKLTLEGAAVKVVSEEYPAGVKFKLPIGEGTILDVYQGEFRVMLRVVAPKGATVLSGSLRYQACDNAACFPPRTLGVKVAVNGR
jgi:hypothetical protein